MGIDIKCYTEVKRDGTWEHISEGWPVNGRNYYLFYFLGHRHSSVFRLPRIAEPRGLPPDLSPEVKAASDLYLDCYCYHSWLTLAELLNYDYDQVVWRERVITEIIHGQPFYYVPDKQDEGEWKDFTLREQVGEWFLYRLRQLREEWGDPENVRIVFWFDQDWTASQMSLHRSDEEVKRLRFQWFEQELHYRKDSEENWPNKNEIYQELQRLGQQETARCEELFRLSQQ